MHVKLYKVSENKVNHFNLTKLFSNFFLIFLTLLNVLACKWKDSVELNN